MKTILPSILVLICLLLAGCELFQQNEYYHLSDARRSLLKAGDLLVYEDCNSKLDTLRVLKKIGGTHKHPLSGSSCGEPAAYFDLELVYFVNQKERGSDQYCSNLGSTTNFGDCEGYYGCTKSIMFLLEAKETKKKSNSNSNQPTLTWYNNQDRYPNQFIESMTVLNQTYSNVYYYEGNFIHYGDSIKGIYYTCQNGIIQMDLMNGNVMKLVK